MTHARIVPRLALAGLVFLAAASAAQANEPGKADYEKQCVRCHTPEAAVDFLKKYPDAKERAAWLDKKLARHYARNPEQRARIIAYLEGLLADPK